MCGRSFASYRIRKYRFPHKYSTVSIPSLMGKADPLGDGNFAWKGGGSSLFPDDFGECMVCNVK